MNRTVTLPADGANRAASPIKSKSPRRHRASARAVVVQRRSASRCLLGPACCAAHGPAHIAPPAWVCRSRPSAAPSAVQARQPQPQTLPLRSRAGWSGHERGESERGQAWYIDIYLEWCKCGDLKAIIDAQGNATRWTHDASKGVRACVQNSLKSAFPCCHVSCGKQSTSRASNLTAEPQSASIGLHDKKSAFGARLGSCSRNDVGRGGRGPRAKRA